jgi:cytochrome b subunit of formate dehydrogenase
MRRNPDRNVLVRLCGFAVFVLWAGVVGLRAQESADCLVCHGEADLVVERDGRKISLFFDEERAKLGVHADVGCIDCHSDLDGVEDFPHAAKLEPASCDMCHDDSFESIAAFVGSTHGKLLEAGDANAPRCADCHGSHEIRKSSDPLSPSYLLNVPRTCTQCHAQEGPVERAGILDDAALVARYKDTIHGAGLFEQGLTVAPVCTSCHTAHGVLPLGDPESSVHKSRVNDTCRQCHAHEEKVHEGIVAAELWAQPGKVPLCVDCHQPHGERREAYGTGMSTLECLECHADPQQTRDAGRPELFVDREQIGHSVHGRHLVACAQCHTDVISSEGHRSCENAGAPVRCGTCHEDIVRQHTRGIHGSLVADGVEAAPSCVDCHGQHGIMESRLPEGSPVEPWLRSAILASPTHRRNVPDLCAECHREGAAAAERNPDGDAQKVAHYRESIHGRGLIESGLIASANCVDCHSAHMELPPSDPASTVSPQNIVATCAQCHDGIDETFRDSIHSVAANPDFVPADGQPGLPQCNDCHSSHSVTRTDLPGFHAGIVEQCGKCHAAITETYFDTYHGKVSKLGSTVAAQCTDCHGAHDILPGSDPASSIHPGENLIGTCAKCHDGAHEEFTRYLAHGSHHDKENYPALYWAFQAMTWLLVGVFSFFGLHLLAWLPRSVALRREMVAHHAAAAVREGEVVKEYQRFNWLNRTLHRMVIVSFLALSVTGLALKFSEADWASVLIAMMGGTVTAGWIHRIGAVITFAYFAIHITDLTRRFLKSGKSVTQYFFGPDSMVPTWKDVLEFIATMKWFFGLGPRPRYGKWTYWEKFDYFAVFWGVAVIGLSGLVLWFPVQATWILPGWAINVATIIHSEEALLATGFIFTIHFFNTHLRPEKFPMDKVVFTGSMPIEELKTERPELYERLVAEGELEKFLVNAPNERQKRRAYVFGSIALAIGVTLLVLLVYGLVTVGL